MEKEASDTSVKSRPSSAASSTSTDSDNMSDRSNDENRDKSSIGSDESLEETAGPDFAEFAKKMHIQRYRVFNPAEDHSREDTIEFPSIITQKETLPKTSDLTTLFLVDSVNRDKLAYPQPTSFSLRLPRVYKNIKSVQLTDVKFLCSFYYFSTTKSNIYLPIIERGRNITTLQNFQISKLITIREGTYNINELLNEIQIELNYTPLFYDFPNGFIDFVNLFSVSGDYSLNFNQPGDTYYDSLNSKYISNPTMATIISYYWGSRYSNLTSYTADQLKVAYYYPVLYEVLLDKDDKTTLPFLNLEGPMGSDGLPASSHVIFNMAGIDDPIATLLINNNIDYLDTYRLNHTFRYSLVNRYQVTYDTNSLRVNFTTTTLNTSLINLINNTSASALTSIFNSLGLTTVSFSNYQANLSKLSVVYTDMYNYLQVQLATLVGIPYGTYPTSFFENLNNNIYFQNGANAVGIMSRYSLAALNSSNIISPLTSPSNSPGYWPNIISTNGYLTRGLSNINSKNSLIPYNIAGKNFLFNSSTIDPSTYFLNVNSNTNSLDVLVNISSTQYTILKFKSPVRQTLQVETLPVPYYYRYSDYNKQGLFKSVVDLSKNNVPQQYFDLSYSFVDYSNADILNYSPVALSPVFGRNFNNSFNVTTSLNINSLRNYYYFEFTAPVPPSSSGLTINNTSLTFISINISNLSTIFTDNFTAFLYHDRAAFMADLGNPRSENPLHYIARSSATPSSTDITINISTFSGHKYYSIFRSDNTACSNIRISPLVYYNNSNYIQITNDYTNFNPYANPFDTSNLSTYAYVTNYNPDFTRLPTSSTLQSISPDNSFFNTSLTMKGLPIGYDISGVSNDLTDYIGFNLTSMTVDPSTIIRYDPLNNYSFQKLSPFNPTTGSYFGQNSSNILLEDKTNATYISKSVSSSQLKIVHWYDGYSIPQQPDDNITSLSTIGIAQVSSMSSILTSFPVYQNSNIMFGRGINAIGFLPTGGVYNVNSFAFKSYIYPQSGLVSSSNDPNLQISYIGVFSGLSLLDTSMTMSSALTLLKFDTSFPHGPKTSSSNFSYGTWYNFIKDTSFSSNTSLSGYTPESNELLSYNSMYYMVPFDRNGSMLTYSLLSGSLLPYPLAQTISTVSRYINNKVAINPPGSISQPQYIIPVSTNNASLAAYGPQGIYSQTQSQYEQSLAITTPSIGYKQITPLVNGNSGLYNFNTSFYDGSSFNTIGLTTHFTEYSNNIFLVNAKSNVCSNASISFPTLSYATSLIPIIDANDAELSCIYYALNRPPVIQNYNVTGISRNFNVFSFAEMPGTNTNITVKSLTLTPSISTFTAWVWGAGGATSSSNYTGGAGAYVKLSLNINTLLNTVTPDCPNGISTLYFVVGKGGNRDDFITSQGSLQNLEQLRYGGGGTSSSNNTIIQQGGGFSGIFTGSNILTATPLLIVGGGGAAGAGLGGQAGLGPDEYGGPAGFGIPITVGTIINYQFSTALFNGIFYNNLPVSSIIDEFNNPVNTGSDIANMVDGNILTYWNPILPSVLNPSNYYPTPNTYGISLNFTSNLPILSKLRYYGPDPTNSLNLPTGIVVYNNKNKTQLLYSNTNISQKDFQLIKNGTFNQGIFEFSLINQPSNTTINSNAWLIGGINPTSANSIQYSLDLINWIPVANPLSSVITILYSSDFGKWFAIGNYLIITSGDGINWTLEFNNSGSPPFNTMCIGNINGSAIGLAGAEDGSIYIYRNGIQWISIGRVLPVPITRLRLLNGKFWAIGGNYLAYSINGIKWTIVLNFTMSTIYDITYGLGYYTIAQSPNIAPLVSPILYSQDGILWDNTATTNLINFTPRSITFGNSTFVAVGSTTDNSSFIKYSKNLVNWSNSSFPTTGDTSRNHIEFSANTFVSVGSARPDPAANQVSVITSSDGIIWSYSLSGGFNSQAGPYSGNSSAYGPITVLPNLSTIYIELQKSSFNSEYLQSQQQLLVYEIRAYSTTTPISGVTDNLIDNNLATIFYPPELETVDVITYPFVFTFNSPVSILHYIQVYTPLIPTAQFTGITISLDATSNSVIYTNSSVTSEVSGTNNLYEFFIIPPLNNISTLYINFTKNTPGSIQISKINGIYDSSIAITLKIVGSIQDIDNRVSSSGNTLSNIIDGNLQTYWSPITFIQGSSLKINVVFSQQADRISHIRIFNGLYIKSSTNFITGIGIFTDSNSLSSPLYYNANIEVVQYMEYAIIDLDISPLIGYNSLFIQLYKNTPGIPIISEIQFFNYGIILSDTTGFSGGDLSVMRRSILPPSIYGGGGGSSTSGGNSGVSGIQGSYLKGGSPAISPVGNNGGGGGGGYYGGGGGGISPAGLGGAGGGGSSYIFNNQPIFKILDYGFAAPGTTTNVTNYISPGALGQQDPILSDIIQATPLNYGQGGITTVDSGQGAHGLIVAEYLVDTTLIPSSNPTVTPKFIDGSKLTLFQAPIVTNTNLRNLSFTTYSDSIQLSQYSGYNWVWYNSYLSLVGNSLTTSMQLSTLTTSHPPAFPNLPTSIYSSLSSQFSNISSFFSGVSSSAQTIATSIRTTFSNFQNTYFIYTQHINPYYVEFTEIYCLLDYLRNISNLTNPHVNPSNPTLDRIFGGIPRFGYWANPFLTNVSYLGFDVTNSITPNTALSTLAQNGNPVQAMYGLVLEQSLSSGIYQFKDIMAYKPSLEDSIKNGSNWLKVTQFNDAYSIRSMTDPVLLDSNVIVQPYTFQNAISARLPLFNYSVYTIPKVINSSVVHMPIQVINDFQGQAINLYSFNNKNMQNISSINYTKIPFTSTTISINQKNLTNSRYNSIMGTIVSQYQSTVVSVITSIDIDNATYNPVFQYAAGSNSYYNTLVSTSQISSAEIGKNVIDYLGNYYTTKANNIYQYNISDVISPTKMSKTDITIASPKTILEQYNSGNDAPYSDFFVSKYTNIWHFPASGLQGSFYGARFTSLYDLDSRLTFANQVFYPTHKIILEKISSLANPITNIQEIQEYSTFQRTQMFFYKNFSSLVSDISGNFAKEKITNFASSDTFSGYGFNSYIYNVNLQASDSSSNPDSFNYLAIRGYSPSEQFQSLVRFYLPNRYDFGYISLKDLSNELLTISGLSNVNPEYLNRLQVLNTAFSTTRNYGSVGIPGFSGSNISTTGFGNFLNTFNQLYTSITSNNSIVSTVNGLSNAALANLITSDLQYILPSYLATRNRVTDPVEFSIPFSSCVNPLNANKSQYGLGFNLGFALEDTDHNTVQRATSFFKILDDYIYLQMNEEFNMNTMGVSQQENFAQTRDSTAQSGVYNSKLMLNTFGSFATTFVHSPVAFNPTIGKLDKLTFTWYDSGGSIINNNDCEWSGSVQIIESVNIA